MNFSVAIVTCTLSFVWKSLELAVEVVLGTNAYVPIRENMELEL